VKYVIESAMKRPIPQLPVFVSLLDALPIKIADGLTILESDVAECLAVQLFGQRVILPMLMTNAGREIVFEGAIAHPIVQIPNVCTLSISHFRLAIHSPIPFVSLNSLAFDITGQACLELHLPAIFGANAILLDGMIHLVTKNALEVQQLRIDFEQAAWSLPLPAKASLWIHANCLDFSLAEDGSAIIEMQVVCSVEGLAPRLQNVLGMICCNANVRWTKDGMTIAAKTVFEKLTIPLPSFAALGDNPAWNLDELALSAKYLRISVGHDLECSLDMSVVIPSILRDFMEPQIDFRFSALNEDVRIELLSSPFRNLDCIRVPNGNLRAKMRVGEGKISFDLPSLHMDWARRMIVAEGQISHKNLRIPLEPLRLLLERAGISSLAKRLPDSVAFESVGLTGIAAAFSNLIANVFRNGHRAEKVQQLFDDPLEYLHHVPQRLQDEFLRVHVPKEIAFRFECTFDFDARVHFSLSNDSIRAAASPIRLLVPLLGPRGPELHRITIYRWSFGELHAGQVLTVELDAEVESFDLTTAVNESQSRLHLRDVVALLGQSGGVPWMVPASFREIGWTYTGADGMTAVFQSKLSLPSVDFSTLMHWLIQVQDPALRGKNSFDLFGNGLCEGHVGPAYLRLPRSLGSQEFGSMNDVLALRSPKELELLLEAWQTLDFHRFVELLPARYGWSSLLQTDLWGALKKR
jgi:hypothetical protein